ncbi:putative multiple-sugar transport system permease YteP [Paenibacillus allorhizoplanae]|uniref:Multiple-sugar transport system permease YteP n=2 Tax=Paenibacillus TaxID=44249 RepID=A0ABN8GSM5_9BACL|nr:ABC transporter permease subunit [Paenibacillus allorhizoplanae]CAH1217147.1 putative multiple-sugar transport system permease YteP [Paenibacillus allorhizoplanae]
MGIFSAIRKESKHFWKARSLFVIGLPAIIVVFIFYYLPMYGIVIAFKDINYAKGIWGSDWVGLHNFKFFFNSQDALRITRNTLLLNGLFIVVGMSCALVIGLLLAELGRRWVKLFQTILFFPYFLSWVVVGFVSYILLNPSFGVINKVLDQFHVAPIDWYSKPGYWPLILTLTYLWKNVGYTAIIFFTGLLSIDNSYYEAASIDGASRLQQIRKISIPLILPLITMLFMLNVGRIFYSDFGLFYFVPRDAGMLYPTTDVVDTYVFRSLRVVGDLGMASAASLYQAVVGLILVVSTNLLVRKFSKDHALF